MGMTNRVIPAQGEEQGASFTLIRLDGDVYRKFQPSHQHFSILPGVGRLGVASPIIDVSLHQTYISCDDFCPPGGGST